MNAETSSSLKEPDWVWLSSSMESPCSSVYVKMRPVEKIVGSDALSEHTMLESVAEAARIFRGSERAVSSALKADSIVDRNVNKICWNPSGKCGTALVKAAAADSWRVSCAVFAGASVKKDVPANGQTMAGLERYPRMSSHVLSVHKRCVESTDVRWATIEAIPSMSFL